MLKVAKLSASQTNRRLSRQMMKHIVQKLWKHVKAAEKTAKMND